MIDEELDETMRAWGRTQVAAAPEVTVPPLPTVSARKPHRAWLPMAAAAAIVTAVAVGSVAFRGGGDGPTRVDPAAGGDPHVVFSGSAGASVVHDGDSVTGSGWVVAPPGQPVRFCAPVPIPGVGYSGPFDPDRECPTYVTVTGVDLATLTGRRVEGGEVTGSATLVGTYRHGTIAVTDQQPDPDRLPDQFDTAPCEAPPGGWPHNGRNDAGNIDFDAIDAYRSAHPGEIVDVAQLNLSASQHVAYVLASGDPAALRAALAKLYDGPLCVTRSDFTPKQVHDAGAAMTGEMGGGALTSPYEAGGTGLGPDEQIVVPVGVPILTDDLARSIDMQPRGLVEVDVWLVPVQ